MTVYSVNYHLYYDLVFRAKYCYLVPGIYRIDFLDYVMAGIAFNTRSYELSTRKISFFAQVYNSLVEAKNDDLVKTAIHYFYEDIFDLYQKYLKSYNAAEIPNDHLVILVPSWEKVAFLRQYFDSKQLDSNLDEYLYQNFILSLSNYRAVVNNEKQLKYIQLSYKCTLNLYNDKLLEVIYE